MDNVKIVKLTLDDVDKVYQFVIEEFCPDEPVFNSFGILRVTFYIYKT